MKWQVSTFCVLGLFISLIVLGSFTGSSLGENTWAVRNTAGDITLTTVQNPDLKLTRFSLFDKTVFKLPRQFQTDIYSTTPETGQTDDLIIKKIESAIRSVNEKFGTTNIAVASLDLKSEYHRPLAREDPISTPLPIPTN